MSYSTSLTNTKLCETRSRAKLNAVCCDHQNSLKAIIKTIQSLTEDTINKSYEHQYVVIFHKAKLTTAV